MVIYSTWANQMKLIALDRAGEYPEHGLKKGWPLKDLAPILAEGNAVALVIGSLEEAVRDGGFYRCK